jgi:hypothetical protein
VSPIPAGSIGELYRTHDRRLSPEVAVKVRHAEIGCLAGFSDCAGTRPCSNSRRDL